MYLIPSFKVVSQLVLEKNIFFLGFYYIYSRRISPSVLIATSSKLQVSRIGKKSRISLYMGQVDSFTSELLALER